MRGQMIMWGRNVFFWAQSVPVLCSIVSFAACGGGTSGTSPIGERTFTGIIVEENGSPIVNEPMTVLAPDSSVLVSSSTGSDGRFAMRLPATAKQFQVALNEQTIQTITTVLPAPSRLAAKVSIARSSGVVSAVVHEARIVAIEGCSALVAAGDRFDLDSNESVVGCRVAFDVAPNAGADSGVAGVFGARCGDEVQFLGAPIEDGSGRIVIEIDQPIGEGCDSAFFQVFLLDGPDLSVVFPVTALR